MKIIQGFLLALTIPAILFADAQKGIERKGTDSKYQPVKAEGYNLQLGDIVLRSMGDEPNSYLDGWAFGHITQGIVFELDFQIRDELGIVTTSFYRKDKQIFMTATDSGLSPILFATIGKPDSGDEDTGRGGENHHWKLKIEIQGLSIVAEDSREFATYSIMLPKRFEELAQPAVVATSQNGGRLPFPLSPRGVCGRGLADFGPPQASNNLP